jgi:GNAT superfamily N-acetyltransferase
VEADGGYDIAEVSPSTELASVTERLLGLLPAWFGIPEANAEYVDSATRLPGFVARAGHGAVGVLLVHRHFRESAEIHLLAVHPAWHRRGIGRALLTTAESALETDGCRFLQVKTLGPSRPDDGYAKTRAFYAAVGFTPLEEMLELWPGNPCLICVKALRVRP